MPAPKVPMARRFVRERSQWCANRKSDGLQLAQLYQMGIPSVQRFESEVRAVEASINLPPEMWTQIQYKRLEGVFVNTFIIFICMPIIFRVSFVQLMFIFAIICLGFWLYKNVKVGFKMTEIMSPFSKFANAAKCESNREAAKHCRKSLICSQSKVSHLGSA